MNLFIGAGNPYLTTTDVSESRKPQSISFCRAEESLICDHTYTVEEENCPVYCVKHCISWTVRAFSLPEPLDASAVNCNSTQSITWPDWRDVFIWSLMGEQTWTQHDCTWALGIESLVTACGAEELLNIIENTSFHAELAAWSGQSLKRSRPSSKRKTLYKGLQGVSVLYLKNCYTALPCYCHFFPLMELILTKFQSLFLYRHHLFWSLNAYLPPDLVKGKYTLWKPTYVRKKFLTELSKFQCHHFHCSSGDNTDTRQKYFLSAKKVPAAFIGKLKITTSLFYLTKFGQWHKNFH